MLASVFFCSFTKGEIVMVKQYRHFFTPNIVKYFGGVLEWICRNKFLNSLIERFFKTRFQATEKAIFSSSSGALFNIDQANLDLIQVDAEIDKNLSMLKNSGPDKNKILSKLRGLEEKRRCLFAKKMESCINDEEDLA